MLLQDTRQEKCELRRYRQLHSVLLLITALVMMGPVVAENLANPSGANPEINRPYDNADVEFWRGVFESENREIYGHRNEIFNALNLQPGMRVADVGAGTGFFSLMFAEAVGPEGRVYAVDISKSFIDAINVRAEEAGLENLTAVMNTQTSLTLPPNSVDLVFVSDTYHHFEQPQAMLASIHDALRPGGSVVIVDFRRIEGQSSPWVMGHVRAGAERVIRELDEAGFRHTETQDIMQTQYFLRFIKPESDAVPPGTRAH